MDFCLLFHNSKLYFITSKAVAIPGAQQGIYDGKGKDTLKQ